MSQINAETPPAKGSNVVSATCSKSIREITDGCYHYVIMGYSSAKGMGVGKYLCSDSFKAGGYEWTIYFYPDGYDEGSSIYTSVYLALASHGTDVRALLELTLVNQSGKGRHIVRGNFKWALKNGPCIFERMGFKWGIKAFIRRSTLEKSQYLKDDCLLLHCKVNVVKNSGEGPRNDMLIPIPPSDMVPALKSMLECGVGCDIAFHVEDEIIKAHKTILAARSPVFMAQFYDPGGDPNLNKVVIEDVKPSIFKAMITFIYSDELPDVHKLADSCSSSTEISIRNLLAAAERYGLARLKLLSEAKLNEEIIVDTVSSQLQVLGTQDSVKRGRNTLGEEYEEL